MSRRQQQDLRKANKMHTMIHIAACATSALEPTIIYKRCERHLDTGNQKGLEGILARLPPQTITVHNPDARDGLHASLVALGSAAGATGT